MITQPRTPPESVHKICTWHHVPKQVVLHWLVTCMTDDCVLTPSNMGAVDDKGFYRWRMALGPVDLRVLLERESDVQLFELTWGGSSCK